ncbi:MAG: MBL fold metallo-hydrolase [Paracoccaceae bacterium]
MTFFTEPPPPRRVAQPIARDVVRVVADNGGPMTCHGTNTYVHDTGAGTVVIDPGPADDAHLAAVRHAAGARVEAIVLTHRHRDHADGAPALARETGAPLVAAEWAAGGLVVDRLVAEGDRVAGLEVLATPGHAPDHVCLATPGGALFTGDHLMAWAPSAVASPDGDAAAYVRALERLRRRPETLYLPGHGPPLMRPRVLIDTLLAMRAEREAAIVEAVARRPGEDAGAIARALYPRTEGDAAAQARRHLDPYLVKLVDEGALLRRAERFYPT